MRPLDGREVGCVLVVLPVPRRERVGGVDRERPMGLDHDVVVMDCARDGIATDKMAEGGGMEPRFGS